MTLTKSWLQKSISDIETMRDEIPFGLDEDGNNTLAALKLALAGMESEPVFKINHDSSLIKHVKKVVRETSAPQPLTTSERAELENYRNAQQVVPDEQHSERFGWTLGQWAEHVGGHHQGNDPENYYEFGSFMAVAAMLRQFGTVQQKLGWNACRAAMLQGKAEQGCKVPDGWVMVPKEATAEMINSAMRDNETGGLDEIYELMIAAAPQQESE